jgi:F0F1-type ATP synthase delta subunit
MERNYAHVLWRLAGQGMEPAKAVRALYEYLKTNGREALMPRIATAFERLAAREDQKNTVTLSVAHEKDAPAAKVEAKELLAMLNLAAEDVAVRIDDSLIGGWRVEGREHLVDASFKKQLLSLYNRATQS